MKEKHSLNIRTALQAGDSSSQASVMQRWIASKNSGEPDTRPKLVESSPTPTQQSGYTFNIH